MAKEPKKNTLKNTDAAAAEREKLVGIAESAGIEITAEATVEEIKTILKDNGIELESAKQPEPEAEKEKAEAAPEPTPAPKTQDKNIRPLGIPANAKHIDCTTEQANDYQSKGKLVGFNPAKKKAWIIPALLLAFSALFGGVAQANFGDEATLGSHDSSGNYRWRVSSTALFPGATNTYDIGSSTAKVKAVYQAGSTTLANDETISNPTDDTVRVASNDEHTTLQVYGFEAKDAILALTADEGDDNADKFTLKMSAAGLLTLEVNGVAFATWTTSTGALAMTGDLSGDGADQLFGFLQDQVASTTVAITAAQAGKTFVSDSADVMTLPEASTVLGARYTFIAGTADDFDINPADASDTILPITASGGTISPAAGDAIRITDAGASVTLEAIGANSWACVAHNGAITDVN